MRLKTSSEDFILSFYSESKWSFLKKIYFPNDQETGYGKKIILVKMGG